MCVALLKRSKTCTFFGRGMEKTYEAPSNEARHMPYALTISSGTPDDVPAPHVHGDETMFGFSPLGFSCCQAVASHSRMETCYCIVTLHVSCFI